MSDLKYGEASLRVNEHFAGKVKTQLNKNVTDNGLRLIKLTNKIPNWQTYLTAKQREATEKYLRCLNAYDVDYQLKLNSGTAHQRLFGGSTSKGALGRLEEVNKLLENDIVYQAEQKKIKAAEDGQKEKKKLNFSKKSIEQMKELIRLVVNMPDYEKHLTTGQIEKVNVFIHTKSIVKSARACGVSIKSFQQALIGHNGILSKLKEIHDSRQVNSWEDI